MANEQFTNWGRNQTCLPRSIAFPRTEAELVDFVEASRGRGERVKVFGAGHSWSNAACTTGHMISLDHLDQTLDVDLARGRVTVGAGIRLHDLVERLCDLNLALQNLGSVAQQSIAGAISTGTHGTGLRFGCLATQVVGLRLLTGRGDLLYLSPRTTPELFSAAGVGLGVLGIITEVTLQCEPAFDIEEHAFALPFVEALDRMMELVHDNEHVKFWWLPHTEHVMVYTYNRTTRRRTGRSLLRTFEERVLNTVGFDLLLRLGARAPEAIPYANRLVAGGYMRTMRRVDRCDRLFTVPMPPVHREAEYGIPYEMAPTALRRLRAMIEHHGLRVSFPVEVRFVAADDFMLSPAFGRPSCQLGAYTADNADRARYFQLFEQLALQMDGRPHWGKEFTLQRGMLASRFPMFERFDQLRRQLDPEGIFVNAFAEQVFGATARS